LHRSIPATQSYLSIERILEAAHQTETDAIHPGYGFLSENEHFARAVRRCRAGIYWSILLRRLPPWETRVELGHWYRGTVCRLCLAIRLHLVHSHPDDEQILLEQIQFLGFPVLVKAAAGGGGKGMRVVTQAGDMAESVAAARREALHAFGDETVDPGALYSPRPAYRISGAGRSHGNTLHLFERECSVQRRHQKIIEETPSSILKRFALRQQMGAAAVAAAQAVGYQNAGTIEFIVDPESEQFYFLEMNTRLQVEHPVTELVTGLDLVQWQIRIAAGERLTFPQDDLHQRGHAIECRLYAEDPANNFLPATGKLLQFVEPRGPGVRVDAGYSSGDEVSIHYDPLIAKVIVWAEDRPAAIRRMQAALRETVLLGLTNNNAFLQDVLADADFQRGNMYTTWVEEHFGDWQPPHCELPLEVLAAAALRR
jgi:acetyl/propionyl-CoA carboxylase alpha subunit